MNKTELIDKIAAGAEITKAQAKAALDAILCFLLFSVNNL